MREGRANNVLDALAADARIPFDRSQLDSLIGNPMEFTGEAREQVGRVVAMVANAIKLWSQSVQYKAGPIR